MSKALIACVAFAVTVHAHDPYEAWASATVHADRMVLIVTMAQSTALRLVDPASKVRGGMTENFSALRPQLRREGASLFVLTSARKPLAPRDAQVELTEENDIVFTVSFPRPGAGPLHFRAAFLEKLGQGYGGILEVRDGAGSDLGWEKLSFENPTFEVEIRAMAPTKPKP